jgi:hypothetical protein
LGDILLLEIIKLAKTSQVRWRQLSEPNDPVWWVDLLPPEQFAEGFGSHTPIVTGQCKTARYGVQLSRALRVMRELAIQQNGLSETTIAELKNAPDGNLNSVYAALRRDCWVTTPCYSDAFSGRILDGTRLTLQFVPPAGFEFSVRTPGTPPRFKRFDEELTYAWQQVDTYARQTITTVGEQLSAKRCLDLALRVAFYWYNCMPLSRGTAALGLTAVMLCLKSVSLSRLTVHRFMQSCWGLGGK